MRRNFIINLIVIITLIAAGWGLTIFLNDAQPPAPPAQAEAPATGQRAPDFTFTAIDGKSHRLSGFKDKIIILNFWASWCAPCIKEMPALIGIAKKFPDDVVLVALSSDMDDKAVHNFLRQQKLAAPQKPGANILFARDSENITGTLFQTYRLPETFIIDPALGIREKFIGADWPEAAMIKAIENARKD